MMRQSFKALAIGQIFRFAREIDEPLSGLARGPWRKVSARKYEHITGPEVER